MLKDKSATLQPEPSRLNVPFLIRNNRGTYDFHKTSKKVHVHTINKWFDTIFLAIQLVLYEVGERCRHKSYGNIVGFGLFAKDYLECNCICLTSF